jgi:hypothetical protein
LIVREQRFPLAIQVELCGRQLQIVAQPESVVTAFAEYFRHYQPLLLTSSVSEGSINSASQPVFRLHLRMRRALPLRERSIPGNAQRLTQSGPMELWQAAATASRPESFYFVNPVTMFRVIPQRNLMTGIITPPTLQAAHILTNTWSLFGLLLLLRHSGIYHLHSAAVLAPDCRLFLLCGGPRSGKTTLTTALGIAGWKPLADDSLFLQQPPASGQTANHFSAQIIPMKKNFHLSRELLSRWQQLHDITWKERDEDRISAAGLEFFNSLSDAEAEYYRADSIILPQIADASESRLERISASETLLALAQQSTFLQLWSAHTQLQMQMLAEIVRHASCWRMMAGRDILLHPQRAGQLLHSIL